MTGVEKLLAERERMVWYHAAAILDRLRSVALTPDAAAELETARNLMLFEARRACAAAYETPSAP